MTSARASAGARTGGIRISSGALRGRRLTAGEGVRPTEARVREALIDRWRSRLPGARVLDLFAGTGAVGLHALSCGAAHCTFVDRTRGHLSAIVRSADGWGLADRVATIAVDWPSQAQRVRGRFDVVFADPPYEYAEHGELVKRAIDLVRPSGELVVEHRHDAALPARAGDATRIDSRRYGECRLTSYRPEPSPGGAGGESA